jgi:hypothetical protein
MKFMADVVRWPFATSRAERKVTKGEKSRDSALQQSDHL